MKPGAQGRRGACPKCGAANGERCREFDPWFGSSRTVTTHPERRKLVAAMRRAVNEVVSSERKAGR